MVDRSYGRPEPHFLVTTFLVIGDQLTKMIFDFDPFNFLFFSVGREVNSAGVFGLNISNGWLIAGSLIICGALFWLLITRPINPPARLGVWLLVGGAFSNLLDRV